VPTFTPPDRGVRTPLYVPGVTPERQASPARFLTSEIVKPPNVWVTTAGVVTETQPPTWEEVRYVYLGGHVSEITQAEADVLTAAGYTVT